MKAKPTGAARFRGPRVHDWVEVVDVPFDGGPRLPPRRRGGQPWRDGIEQKWNSWRSIPHAVLWAGADWQYALDTAELAAPAFQKDTKVGAMAELRLREKTMGTTWAARQDMRIRYVAPVDECSPTHVTRLEDYRDL
jgi:hypothetical protein